MKTSIKELRAETKKIFSAVKSGKVVDVYYHRECIARIIPFKKESPIREDYGFGMWSDYSDTKNVSAFSRQLRKGRKQHVG